MTLKIVLFVFILLEVLVQLCTVNLLYLYHDEGDNIINICNYYILHLTALLSLTNPSTW